MRYIRAYSKNRSIGVQTQLLKIDPEDLSPSQLDVLIAHKAKREFGGTGDPHLIASAIAEAEAELDRQNPIAISAKVVGEKNALARWAETNSLQKLIP